MSSNNNGSLPRPLLTNHASNVPTKPVDKPDLLANRMAVLSIKDELSDDIGTTTEVLDDEAQQRYLEEYVATIGTMDSHFCRMYDEQARDKLRNLKEIQLPTAKLLTKLKKHQVEGARWLISQELSGAENPFFKKMTFTNHQAWRCRITGIHTREPPAPIRGSILADEMGLGSE